MFKAFLNLFRRPGSPPTPNVTVSHGNLPHGKVLILMTPYDHDFASHRINMQITRRQWLQILEILGK